MMTSRLESICALALLGLVLGLAPAPADESEPMRLDFEKPGWELAGEGTVIEELDGQTALRLVSGNAIYRDLEFSDGTIEFDLRVTLHRSFAYLYFRMQNDNEHEEIYFRPHKTRLPDAIQYAPVYKGRSQWQLYHDAGSTAAANLPPGEWIPIKLVVEGSRAAVFVGAAEVPQLIVRELAHDPQPGFIALRSFMTFGTPPNTHVANFANVVVRPGVIDYEFPDPEATTPVAGLIAEWDLSPAFAPADGAVLELPAETLATEWKTAAANPGGLLEIERHVTRPEGVRRATVLARLRLSSENGGTRRLALGFSDELSVFLNGRLLTVVDQSYSFNAPRRQGLLTADQISVFLPLEKGDNEIILAITDRFGGWGLSGRVSD
jgi:hypothetical protein